MNIKEFANRHKILCVYEQSSHDSSLVIYSHSAHAEHYYLTVLLYLVCFLLFADGGVQNIEKTDAIHLVYFKKYKT